MSYIGTPPSNAFTSLLKQDFSTSATTGYTLDHAVNNANDIALFINFVRQEPTAGYAASGTSLVLTSATASSDDMYCVYLGQALQTVNPANASVGTAQLIDGAVTSAKLASGTGGKVLQVVSANKTDTFTSASSSYVDLTGITVNITPSATSSKILVMCSLSLSVDGGGAPQLKLLRDSTALNLADAAGSRGRTTTSYVISATDVIASVPITFLDSPSSTSQLTYKVQGFGYNTNVIYVNRTSNDADAAYRQRASSSITVMEIGA